MRKLHHEIVWHRLQTAAILSVTVGLSRSQPKDALCTLCFGFRQLGTWKLSYGWWLRPRSTRGGFSLYLVMRLERGEGLAGVFLCTRGVDRYRPGVCRGSSWVSLGRSRSYVGLPPAKRQQLITFGHHRCNKAELKRIILALQHARTAACAANTAVTSAKIAAQKAVKQRAASAPGLHVHPGDWVTVRLKGLRRAWASRLFRRAMRVSRGIRSSLIPYQRTEHKS